MTKVEIVLDVEGVEHGTRVAVWLSYFFMLMLATALNFILMVALLVNKSHKSDHVFLFGTFLGGFVWSLMCGLQCGINGFTGEYLGDRVACVFQSFYHYFGIGLMSLSFIWFAYRNYIAVFKLEGISYQMAWKHFAATVLLLFVGIGFLGSRSSMELKSTGNWCLFSDGSLAQLLLQLPLMVGGSLVLAAVYTRLFFFLKDYDADMSAEQLTKMRRYQMRMVRALFVYTVGFGLFGGLPMLVGFIVEQATDMLWSEHIYGVSLSFWTIVAPVYIAYARPYLFEATLIKLARLKDRCSRKEEQEEHPSNWTLETCLASQRGIAMLDEFLQAEYSAENIYFMIAVQQFLNRIRKPEPKVMGPSPVSTKRRSLGAPRRDSLDPPSTNKAPTSVSEEPPDGSGQVPLPTIWVKKEQKEESLLEQAIEMEAFYVSESGSMQVNLPSKMQRTLQARLDEAKDADDPLPILTTLWNDAFMEIFNLLRNDKWPRFQQTLQNVDKSKLGVSRTSKVSTQDDKSSTQDDESADFLMSPGATPLPDAHDADVDLLMNPGSKSARESRADSPQDGNGGAEIQILSSNGENSAVVVDLSPRPIEQGSADQTEIVELSPRPIDQPVDQNESL
eukprot:gb/GEZN01003002.1/.p1 GENE.gb/GEZN01003002.1/~~gb/GEZN01003002.1/.p1  ORF type:complete len:618 (+),score=118.23 gb/GEZN01003002.1/:143-1996(+)